jgi:hypothetical protein
MAHFARVINGVVKVVHVLANDVITDSDGVEHEELGKQFLADLHGYNPDELVQTSYNNSFRGVFAGGGYEYHADGDFFVMPSFPSWVLNKKTFKYEAPIPMPTDGADYTWNESAQAWDAVSEA